MRQDITIKDIPPEITYSALCRLLDIHFITLRRWVLSGRISKGRKVFSNRVFTRTDFAKALRLQK